MSSEVGELAEAAQAKFVIGGGSEDEETKELYDLPDNTSTSSALNRPQYTDEELLRNMREGTIKHRELETVVYFYLTRLLCAQILGGDTARSVRLRRQYLGEELLRDVPMEGYNYDLVLNTCCENVIGYIPVPLGCAGPLKVNGREVLVPLSTTEGALIASINRGCSILSRAGGVTAKVWRDGMTRAPVVKCESLLEAEQLAEWLRSRQVFSRLKAAFDATSRFASLQKIDVFTRGDLVFPRFVATTGDAMGMNMVSKGTQAAMRLVEEEFPHAEVLALSGNVCADKKATEMNWREGRGKSVTAKASIPGHLVPHILKCNVDKLIQVAEAKLDVGSSIAGAIGGKNAHAANIVAAIFLATGQDMAQVVSSSMCETKLGKNAEGGVEITCQMNCLEVGTIGGGTILPAQKKCLELLGCAGPCVEEPGRHAHRLAEVICATVVAGELSLLASLASKSLIDSHLRLNRSQISILSTGFVGTPTSTVSAPSLGTLPRPNLAFESAKAGSPSKNHLIRLDSNKRRPAQKASGGRLRIETNRTCTASPPRAASSPPRTPTPKPTESSPPLSPSSCSIV